jgi:AmmeMemoRadiSam system protein A
LEVRSWKWILEGSKTSPSVRDLFGAEERQRLLTLARRSLEARVRRAPAAPPDTRTPLDVPSGAFVSIHTGPRLRGCLGRITRDWALGRVVAHLAEAVSYSDPRFDPVTVDELSHLHIEISVLSPEVPMAGVGAIEVGRHGLIVELDGRRGLLLPQVAVQYGWDAVTFLDHTCLKAGLPPQAWEHDARVYLFEAHVFSEPQQAAEE